MGSILDAARDADEQEVRNAQILSLTTVSDIVKKLPPGGEDYKMIKYLWTNREKIYRNKRLIDLLG